MLIKREQELKVYHTFFNNTLKLYVSLEINREHIKIRYVYKGKSTKENGHTLIKGITKDFIYKNTGMIEKDMYIYECVSEVPDGQKFNWI